MAVLRVTPNTFHQRFHAEGLGCVFDGLIILAMDGEQAPAHRALLPAVFMPQTVNGNGDPD